MNRGSSSLPSPYGRTAAGFNEAPIHESGKSVACLEPYRLDSGFNEAPIHESGKCCGTSELVAD